jgi:hypothetical protein
MDRTVTFKQEETSGHEPRLGLDTKTGGLTDRQSQCDFDSNLKLVSCKRICEETTWSVQNSHCQSRYQGTTSGDCNRLKRLSVCCSDF